MSRSVRCLAFVGAVLWGGLSLAHFLQAPSTGAPLIVPVKPATMAVIDPYSSKVERAGEPAAIKAELATEAGADSLLVAKFIAAPAPFAPAVVTEPEKPKMSQQAALPVAAPQPLPAVETVSIVGVQTPEEVAAARAQSAAGRKAKLAKAKAKARNAQMARERAARERFASNQQDQFYYGHQQQPYPPAFTSRQSSAPFATASAAAPAPKMADRKTRTAKAKAKKVTRYAASQPGQSRFGQSSTQAMPQVSAFAPQRSYGPFGRGW